MSATTIRTPNDILDELDAVMQEQERLAALLSPLSEREAVLRAALSEAMRAQGIKTVIHGRLQATETVRRDTRIVDQAEVEAALREIGALERCQETRLNAAEVKRVAKERGELLPGMEATETRYLSVKVVER